MSSTRRAVLKGGAAAAVAVGLGVALPSAATARPHTEDRRREIEGRIRTGATSANGWPTEKAADIGGAIWTRPVPGSDVRVAVRMGEVEAVLVYVIRRFHYEVDTLRAGEVTGFRSGVRRTGPTSNYASGTAVAIRPGWYPPGATGELRPHQRAVIADIVRSCRGVVEWGGTFRTPHEAHFQIGVGPHDPRLAEVAELVRGWESKPGQGAGVLALGA